MTDGGGARAIAERKAFGQRLRELRKSRRLSQERLAELAGLHRTYVSSVELGHRNVGLDNIYALAAALGVEPRELFPKGPHA
jgi:transcriptional regulator with XRE-family HTH domain